MNNDQDAPWWVYVERLGKDPRTKAPLSKGRKFYCGAGSEAEALEIAAKQTHDSQVAAADETGKPFGDVGPRFGYTVGEKPK